MNAQKVAIIGCGNLGTSITRGLLDNAAKDYSIIATRRNLEELQSLTSMGVEVTSNNVQACTQSDIILLAVKPYNLPAILKELKEVLSGKILVSLVTGVSLEDIKSHVGPDVSVLRAMPNTATDVKESVTCICTSGENPANTRKIIDLFNHLGITLEIDEELMDSATILGACGIAYAMRFIRAMVQGGIEIGFSAQTAGVIVNQTVKGAAELLIERKHHPEYEIDKVTTPKGCTIVGLNEMEHNGFSSSLIKGIVTSFEKID
jgi:pyrroline-5-carboxylate reductase